jgi:glyoxylase-like metal-dependent hydrolase (beta-lactamase superfamily II)
MYLPGPKILFASDLVIVESHPYLGDADPQGWLRVLDWIESLSPLIVVPGHGPVAGAESIGQIRAYIHHILDRSKRIAGEKDLEEASARMEIPAEYTGWGHAKLYAANLSSLARRHTSKRD